MFLMISLLFPVVYLASLPIPPLSLISPVFFLLSSLPIKLFLTLLIFSMVFFIILNFFVLNLFLVSSITFIPLLLTLLFILLINSFISMNLLSLLLSPILLLLLPLFLPNYITLNNLIFSSIKIVSSSSKMSFKVIFLVPSLFSIIGSTISSILVISSNLLIPLFFPLFLTILSPLILNLPLFLIPLSVSSKMVIVLYSLSTFPFLPLFFNLPLLSLFILVYSHPLYTLFFHSFISYLHNSLIYSSIYKDNITQYYLYFSIYYIL